MVDIVDNGDLELPAMTRNETNRLISEEISGYELLN